MITDSLTFFTKYCYVLSKTQGRVFPMDLLINVAIWIGIFFLIILAAAIKTNNNKNDKK